MVRLEKAGRGQIMWSLALGPYCSVKIDLLLDTTHTERTQRALIYFILIVGIAFKWQNSQIFSTQIDGFYR